MNGTYLLIIQQFAIEHGQYFLDLPDLNIVMFHSILSFSKQQVGKHILRDPLVSPGDLMANPQYPMVYDFVLY